jgi:ribosome-binding protein aMBF1 (putative translation factor)
MFWYLIIRFKSKKGEPMKKNENNENFKLFAIKGGVATALRQWRVSERLSASAVAKDLGVCFSAFSKFERGIILPSPVNIAKLEKMSKGQVTLEKLIADKVKS